VVKRAGHEGPAYRYVNGTGVRVLNEPGTEAPAYRGVNGAGHGGAGVRVSKGTLDRLVPWDGCRLG